MTRQEQLMQIAKARGLINDAMPVQSEPEQVQAPMRDPMVPAPQQPVVEEQPVAPVVQPEAKPALRTMQQEYIEMQGNAVDKYTQAVELEKQAELKAGEAGSEQAKAEEAFLNAKVAEQEQALVRDTEKQLGREAKVQEQLNTLYGKMEALDSQEVDPDRYWASRSTGQKILTGIGMFLGAFGSGGENRAASIVERAIDQDIQLQLKSLDRKRQTIQDQKGIVSQMSQSYNNMAQIENASRAAALQNVQLQLEAFAAKYRSPAIKAQKEKAVAQLEQKKQENIMKFKEVTLKQIVDMESKAPVAGADPLIQGIMTKVPEKLQAKAMEEQGIIQSLNTAKENIGQAFDTVKNTGSIAANIPFTESKAAVDAAKSSIMAAVQANWKGPMSDSDLARIDGLMPSSTDTPQQVEARRKQMLQVLETNAKPTPILKSYGLINQNNKEATTVKMMDPNGVVRNVPKNMVKILERQGGRLVD